MNMPKIVYHGTFWPERNGPYPKTLITELGYVSTTPDERWARYFADNRRLFHRKESGYLLIYTIDTDKLPGEVRKDCVSPEEPDPRPWVRETEDWREERIEIREWRFPYIPGEAIIHVEEEHRDAEPTLSVFDMDLRPTKISTSPMRHLE